MRNFCCARTAARFLSDFSHILVLFAAGVIGLSLLVGCAGAEQPKPQQRQSLNAIGADLDQQHYDEALAAADEYLKQNPQGPGTAQALYLRGRSLQGRTASSAADSKANWQQAREAYVQALAQNPEPLLQAYIRASLANVAYFQEDYAAALQQWTSAYDKLDREDLKAWSLYRSGLCQQRLGRFIDADRTFAQVQQNYPNTVPGQRAREHQGVRSFYVQLATFRSTASFDKASSSLRAQGVVPVRSNDSRGYSILRIGPFSTYADAKRQQQRFASQYPDALIVP